MPFVKETIVTGTFDGKEIRAVLSPISMSDLLDVEDLDTAGEKGRKLIELLPRYLLSLDGVDAPIEEILSTGYYGTLVANLARALAQASKPEHPFVPAEPSGG